MPTSKGNMYDGRRLLRSYTEMKAAFWSICIIARQNFSHGDNVVSDGSRLRVFMVKQELHGIFHFCTGYNVNNN